MQLSLQTTKRLVDLRLWKGGISNPGQEGGPAPPPAGPGTAGPSRPGGSCGQRQNTQHTQHLPGTSPTAAAGWGQTSPERWVSAAGAPTAPAGPGVTNPGSGALRSPCPGSPARWAEGRGPAGAPQPALPEALPRRTPAPRLQKLNKNKISTEELYKPCPAY